MDPVAKVNIPNLQTPTKTVRKSICFEHPASKRQSEKDIHNTLICWWLWPSKWNLTWNYKSRKSEPWWAAIEECVWRLNFEHPMISTPWLQHLMCVQDPCQCRNSCTMISSKRVCVVFMRSQCLSHDGVRVCTSQVWALVLACWWVISVCESNATIGVMTAMPHPPTHKRDEFLELANLQPLGEPTITPIHKHLIVAITQSL